MAWVLPGIAIGSSLLNAWMANKQSSDANRRYNQIYGAALPFMSEGPSSLEEYLSQYMTQNPLGSDSILQSMRSDPTGSAATQALSGFLGTGNPFDTSKMWEAYMPVRQRNLDQSIAQMRGGMTGLGQRFGSSTLMAEKGLRRQAAEDWNAADTTMGMQAYEAAQGRKMGAAEALLNNLLQATQLGTTSSLGFLQLLGNMQNARMGRQLGALQVAGGIPTNQYPQYGGYGMDIAQMLLMQQMINQMGKKGTTSSINYGI